MKYRILDWWAKKKIILSNPFVMQGSSRGSICIDNHWFEPTAKNPQSICDTL
jgi:hypothetical protein